MIQALFAVASLATGPAQPDPYEIFARARAYWSTQRYPASLQYDVAVSVTENGKRKTERYAESFDAINDVIAVDPVSDYESAHPQKVSGINIGIALGPIPIPLGKPLSPVDWVGVPRLAPNYSFGMAPFVPAPTPTPFNSAALVDEIRREFHDPNPRASAESTATPGLSEIATVVAHNRDYQIMLLGTQTIDGHDCYHLALKPERDPGRLRIREAWIDERSYATWQLVDAVNFRRGPLTKMPWTIHFADVDGAHYIREEDAAVAVAKDGLLFSDVAINVEKIRTAPALTGILDASGSFFDEP